MMTTAMLVHSLLYSFEIVSECRILVATFLASSLQDPTARYSLDKSRDIRSRVSHFAQHCVKGSCWLAQRALQCGQLS